MILLFRYDNKSLKFTPHNQDMDLIQYANSNLPNGTPYKIVDSTDNLTEQDYTVLLDSPDGFSNNNLF